MKQGQFILSVLVANHAGVLTRVSGLFSRRNYNIDSLNVAVTEDPLFSRMTIIARGDQAVREQITKQLSKLQDVKKIELLTPEKTVLREHLLIKIKVTKKTRGEIVESVNIFRGRVVDFNIDALTVEVTGESDKLDAFIKFVSQFGILEMCRAGALAVKRGAGNDNKEEE
ncbi:MAG TPA: acetolactate synthase small subunit [Clostridia bacterium]|jgi:acetolactate synthase-1/3 small subunit|nr:acetolactate synthase small subunit [Clostridiaceae bacterium]HOF26655.1 acetolactate synthase small subunit [Clostridia bacterium]HOM34168.1 acetolactate synthase small subunit [Clostridia bacterium]HOR89833.1 acetolactate synthase small subunit [Clostridia bacterium]HOT71228.1 acetolactate synthase small subunit [Clostridia bacterium]